MWNRIKKLLLYFSFYGGLVILVIIMYVFSIPTTMSAMGTDNFLGVAIFNAIIAICISYESFKKKPKL